MTTSTIDNKSRNFFKIAFGLSIFTIIYNIDEGFICTYLGFTDESLVLFGFGADNFIETISGFGILHRVTRIQAVPNSNLYKYIQTALRVPGFSFYPHVLGQGTTSIYNIVTGQQPTTTLWGVIIAAVSIAIMCGLVHYKTKVGKALNSVAIIAEASCTKVCIYICCFACMKCTLSIR